MARRKRKTTLFDVINKGSGLTPPSYVNRPVRRDDYPPPRSGPGLGQVLADWLARKLEPLSTNRPPSRSATPSGSASAPRNGLSELEAMRRELGGSSAPTFDEPAVAVAVREPEPEPELAPAPPRRSALDALAAMRSELSAASTPSYDDVVEGEEVDQPRPAVEVKPKLSKRAARRAMERLETTTSAPPSAADPTARFTTEYSVEQPDPEPKPRKMKAPRRPFGEVIAPYLDRSKRVAAKLSASCSAQLASLRTRINELLDRVTTQNGHRLALGRYTPFIVGGGVIGVVLFAFVLGQVFRPRTPSAAELAAKQAVNDGVRPDVLLVGNAASRSTPEASVPARANQPLTAGNIDQRQPAPTLTRRAGKANRPETRGDNFIVVQSFVNEVDADAAVEVLAKYGVDCTVEKNIPRWTPPGQMKDRFYVLTLDGFTSKGTIGSRTFERLADNPDYAAITAKLAQINDAEVKKTLPSRLDPRPYKWEGRAGG